MKRYVLRRYRRFLSRLMGSDQPPERVAMAFAIGVFISFTPFLGTHLVSALLLAVVLKLKKVDVILGSLVVNPWTMAPVYTAAIVVGRICLGEDFSVVPDLPWGEISIWKKQFWSETLVTLRPYLWAWGIGCMIFAVVGGLATYAGILQLLRFHRARRQRRRDERSLGRQPSPPA